MVAFANSGSSCKRAIAKASSVWNFPLCVAMVLMGFLNGLVDIFAVVSLWVGDAGDVERALFVVRVGLVLPLRCEMIGIEWVHVRIMLRYDECDRYDGFLKSCDVSKLGCVVRCVLLALFLYRWGVFVMSYMYIK